MSSHGARSPCSRFSRRVVTGFVTALMGFWVSLVGDRHAPARAVQHHGVDPAARTAIVMPICNEDVATVFSGLRATCESVAASGHAPVFDVFILSDSSLPEIIAAERTAWAELRAVLAAHPQQPQIEVYYRCAGGAPTARPATWRTSCRRWGRDYRYMVVLDADSVMSGTASSRWSS